jgi:hypothetical protein
MKTICSSLPAFMLLLLIFPLKAQEKQVPVFPEQEIMFTSATLGALGGYGLMYSGVKKNALSLNSRIDLDMHLNPMGLLMNKLNQPFTPALAGMYTIGSLNMRF